MGCFRWALVALFLATSYGARGADFMFAASFADRQLEGKPLFWTASEMLILARDGSLHTIDPREAQDARRTASRFQGYSTSEMRTALYEEFGRAMNVTSTGHYLVVHRRGESDAWAQRFEQLHRAFQNYFRVRGFQLSRPQFPLVAVIFGSEHEYMAYARSTGARLLPNTLGHYDPKTNRVLMYDRVANGDNDWGTTANTIVHEATHQTAFNVGLHNRTVTTPKWVVEGLATLFEARGVYQSQASDTRRQRLNLGRLEDFRYYNEGRKHKSVVAELVASDDVFRRAPERAYAGAWALTFYLSETRPRDYEKYLKQTASREPLTEYRPADRLRDFQAVFGKDFAVMENNFFTWMNDLR